MIDESKVKRIEWYTFVISAPIKRQFIDCWVYYYDDTIYHFRYHQLPPQGAPYQIYNLGWPYEYLSAFGMKGDLPYAFYSEFTYQCNNWFKYTLINYKNGRKIEIGTDQGS